MKQLSLFARHAVPFRSLTAMENAAVECIWSHERHGRHAQAADEMSAVTMRRLEVARLNGWSPTRREVGRARDIGGFTR